MTLSFKWRWCRYGLSAARQTSFAKGQGCSSQDRNTYMSSGNAGAEYHSNSSNSSSSPTSLSDIHLARSWVESTLPTRFCGQIFKNHFVNGGNKNETAPTRQSRPNFSGLCSGYSVAESISASSCESRPQSTPITSSDRYRSAIGEVVDDHNHPNDENKSTHYTTEKIPRHLWDWQLTMNTD